MRVTVKIEGGLAHFPGLAKAKTADTERLAPEASDRLRELVASADFFQLPNAMPAPQGSADLRTYTVSVEGEPRTHRVSAVETMLRPSLRALVEFVRANGS